MLADFRHALRHLVKSPGYTLVAVLTLALGIGACTAVFSIVNTVVLRPLDFPASQQLVAVRAVLPAFAQTYPTVPVNARFYEEWRKDCPALSSLALVDRNSATLTGSGDPERVAIVRASANLFATLRVTPVLGRSFAADEDAAGKPAVAILSDRCWRNQFAADPGILGRAITLDQRRVTVIGVLPASFRLPEARQFSTGQIGPSAEPGVFVLKHFDDGELNDIVGRFNYEVVGRLASGATFDEALAQMNVVAARLTKLSGAGLEVRGFLAPLHEAVVGSARHGLYVLLGGILAVLLIACLNLSMLALARAERRSHDLAVRAALGASRARLLRETLAESLLISLAGGVLGCLFTSWGLQVLLGLAPADLPRLDEVQIDPTVLCFAIGITVATSLLAGLIPAVRAARIDAIDALRRAASRTATGGTASRRLRRLLIGLEAGISTVLLTAAALFAASFLRLMQVDPGFRAPNVLSTEIAIPYAKYPADADRDGYYRRLLAAVQAAPGVTRAAVATALPLQGETWIDAVWAPGDTRPPAERPQTNVRFVSADFFQTLGIPLIEGRTFRDSDQRTGYNPILLSAQLAARLFPGQDAIGRKVLHGDGETYEVIGLVGDVRADADHRPVPVLYQPYWAWPPARAVLVARIQTPAAVAAPALRAAIRGVDGDVPVGRFATMHDILADSAAQRRFQFRLVAAFALAALTLVALGIHGVVAHSVTQRTREIGIRLAFGAEPSMVHRMMLRQGFAPIGWGLLGGIAAALTGARLVSGLLYDTDARSPAALAGVAFVLSLVALLACWLSARRAARIDPMTALRTE